MASIELQIKAKLMGKRLKRPTAKVRPSSLLDTQILIELTAPDGTRCLIDVDTHRDHKGLTVHVRPKFDGSKPDGEDVSLKVHPLHMTSCAIARHYKRGDARILAARCDCGADYVPAGYGWTPAANETENLGSNPIRSSDP